MPIATHRHTPDYRHQTPGKDAIALLKADHERISAMFGEYAKTRAAAVKKALVAQICKLLGVHTQIEEELFYPAIRLAMKDREMVSEALVEHATLRHLMDQIRDIEPDGWMYDARVKVLSEYVRHHVKEEHIEMFPRAKASSLDLVGLGARMAMRRDELMAAPAPPGAGADPA